MYSSKLSFAVDDDRAVRRDRMYPNNSLLDLLTAKIHQHRERPLGQHSFILDGTPSMFVCRCAWITSCFDSCACRPKY